MLAKNKMILGMNARNLSYLRPFNTRAAIAIADSKLVTKRVLEKAGIPTPKLYGVLEDHRALRHFDWSVLPPSFVVKPNFGLGGEGIWILFGRNKQGKWVRARGETVNFFDLTSHISTILDGHFSMMNLPDIVLFEKRIQMSKTFKPYSFRGIPDIRVIVFNNVPVMAMLRLPTKQSQGKANLHLGGIGVGIDLATGVTTTAMHKQGWFDQKVDRSPDSKLPLSGIKIPDWDTILEMAIACQNVSGLGYIGVDVAIDKEQGPVVLEINARAGLSIQVANLASLRERLERVRGLKVKDAPHGIRVAKNLFGGQVEKEIEELSGREVIGLREKVTIFGKEELKADVEAKIDTGADRTSLDRDIAEELGFADMLTWFDTLTFPHIIERGVDARAFLKDVREKYLGQHPDLTEIGLIYSSHGMTVRPKVQLTIRLSGRNFVTNVSIVDRRNLRYTLLVGRNDLSQFLIDPRKV
ncbi:MAG: hypothetical protein HYV34_04420 [Candidatus Kerfeldbacteria bacterium]|nr:hypothetical protein [Candidatus Kerfeldbacteria bacterium]